MTASRHTHLPDWRNLASGTALLFDFDGTLAPIVEDPASARPGPGAVDLLDRLAGHYSTVALISGRPRDFLLPLVTAAVDVVGLYGLERRVGGVLQEHDQAGSWRETIADVSAAAAASAPPGVMVENKGLSLTLHYRSHPELADAVLEWARRQGGRSGLTARAAKMSIELHPPIASDKGMVVSELGQGCDRVLFAGDDLGDLTAFRALAELADGGADTVGVAVGGDELPDDVKAAADIVFDEPAQFIDALQILDPR